MKLSKWCKNVGVSYATGLRWFHLGKIPNAYQIDTKTILVKENSIEDIKKDTNNNVPYIQKVAIYARVSKRERKNDLDRQVNILTEFANKNGFCTQNVYKEISSGVNDERKVFWEMIDENYDIIIIENKDVLATFGFNYIEKLLLKLNTKIIVINHNENIETDITEDIFSVIKSFCYRLYGSRKGNSKATEIKNNIMSV